MNPTGPVVVGVDSSENAKLALRWAAAQAASTQATLEAVTTWDVQPTFGVAMVTAPAPHEYEQAAAQALHDSVVEVLGEDSGVIERVERGEPAEVLVGVSDAARLLVVGSRGRGTWGAALLGSVSQHCVQQSRCPVVVVPQDHAA